MEETLGAPCSNSTDETTQLDVRTLDSDQAKTTFVRRAHQAKWPFDCGLGS